MMCTLSFYPSYSLFFYLLRPSSGRSNGIRKLDILMNESREKMKSESTTRGQDVSSSAEYQETEHENSILQEYSIRKSARTFDDWLQMKRSQEKKNRLRGG